MVCSAADGTGMTDDLVAIWHQDKKVQPMLKRLTLALPPLRVHPDSEVMPVIICEQSNPPRRYIVPIDTVSAVHKVVAVVSMGAGWDGDGWYAYEWPGGDMLVDKVKVMTKKGAVRKTPLGQAMRYDSSRNKVHKLSVRVFN